MSEGGAHDLEIEGNLVLSGTRAGIQIGPHEVIHVDDLLKAIVGRRIVVKIFGDKERITIEVKKP